MAINWNNMAQWAGIVGNYLRGSVAEGFKKEMETSHGFEGEAIKETTFQEARRKGFVDSAGVDKIRRIEKLLRTRSGMYFQNYCDVLKEFSKLSKPVIKEDLIGTGTKQKVVKTFDPDWVSPGIAFFKDLAETPTDDEALELLESVGVFQDAPYGGIRVAISAAKWVGKKDFGSVLKSGIANSAAKAKSGAQYVASHTQTEEAAKTAKGVVLMVGVFVAILIAGAFVLVIKLGNLIQF